MATIFRFEDIVSWQEARKLNRKIGELIKEDRFKGIYPLVNQVLRSGGSVMDNIAEGFERNGKREFIQFLSVSKASCGELRSQLYRMKDLEIITNKEFEELKEQTLRISFLIQRLINNLKQSELKGAKYK